jgi:hypothetical protein
MRGWCAFFREHREEEREEGGTGREERDCFASVISSSLFRSAASSSLSGCCGNNGPRDDSRVSGKTPLSNRVVSIDSWVCVCVLACLCVYAPKHVCVRALALYHY